MTVPSASVLYDLRIGWESEEEEDRKGKGCMLQFQHALVRVLTHFVADQSDPREPLAYFLGEDWQVDVSRLVRYFLKVEDPRIARLQAGRVLYGRNFGVTTVQVNLGTPTPGKDCLSNLSLCCLNCDLASPLRVPTYTVCLNQGFSFL